MVENKKITYHIGMNGEDIKKILGTSLKEVRTSKGLTQEKLAELINKQTGTIYRIETGVNFVNCETFANLCNVLEVPPAVLLSPSTNTMLKEHAEYMNAIKQLLQTFPPDKLQDVYKMLLLLSKYFT